MCGRLKARDGQRYCLKCHREYMRGNRPKHSALPERSRLRANARAYANVYLKRGKLKKKPCERCGTKNVQMHHDDYNQPLQVRWMCRQCHLRLHGQTNCRSIGEPSR